VEAHIMSLKPTAIALHATLT